VLKLGDSNSSSFWLTFFRSVNGILCILWAIGSTSELICNFSL
jgi:hypothetical protein